MWFMSANGSEALADTKELGAGYKIFRTIWDCVYLKPKTFINYGHSLGFQTKVAS